MPSVYQLKPAFQSLLKPAVRALAAGGVTANQITLFACFLSLATGAFLSLHSTRASFFLLPAVLLVRMALNAIDGMLAREHGMASRLGAMLNEICDAISDVALYFPFMILREQDELLVIAILLLTLLSELAGIAAVPAGASRRYDGPMGKSDRAVIFSAVAFAIALGTPFGFWLTAVYAAVAILLVATVGNRVMKALEEKA